MRQLHRIFWPQLHSLTRRPFSTAVSEKVDVKCGSAGHVTIDLFNVLNCSSVDDPLLIHLPPFPSQNDSTPQLPSFLQNRPVASINYRWRPFSENSGQAKHSAPLHWPTPVHDTSFAFSWLIENLPPPGNSRRDIYIYGSYLGASLATSLALTEAHSHARFGVRGFVAYNGIYNWTMFLPDHRINKASKRTKSATLPPGPDESSHLHKLQDHMPVLFDKPSNLFDPFASPSLFFHSPGLLVPQSFFMSVEHAALIDGMTSSKGSPDQPVKVPRKSHLVFPPRKSTLKIPETLLLFDSAKPPAINPSIESKGKRKGKQAQSGGHSFKTQAMELAELMRRSIDVVELKERSKWDEDIVDRADEAVRRVQVIDIGPGGDSIELTEAGNDAVASWMENKI